MKLNNTSSNLNIDYKFKCKMSKKIAKKHEIVLIVKKPLVKSHRLKLNKNNQMNKKQQLKEKH